MARDVQSTLQKYRELQDIIAILGMDELSEEDKLTVERASNSILLVTKLPCSRTIHWSKGSYVPVKTTVAILKTF